MNELLTMMFIILYLYFCYKTGKTVYLAKNSETMKLYYIVDLIRHTTAVMLLLVTIIGLLILGRI